MYKGDEINWIICEYITPEILADYNAGKFTKEEVLYKCLEEKEKEERGE